MIEALSTSGIMIKILIISNFVINLLLSTSLQYLWGMINTL